jgi:2-polyprenyl-3-methyl-5-hydroxy-6-metoxy-1,4-benzoquinol methylase
MEEWKKEVQKHYKSAVDDYTRQYQPIYDEYPANQKRLDFMIKRLFALRPSTLLDCGCGEGSPIRSIAETGIEVWGFDFVPEMVEKAKINLHPKGLSGRVWAGDITDIKSFRPTDIDIPETFDVCMAMGVFPHLTDETNALKNMAAVTRNGGRVFVEFRNELFSLFTLNRYSYAFFLDNLMKTESLIAKKPGRAAEIHEITEKMKPFFRLDQPPVRSGSADAPGYDKILSKFHNPLDLSLLFNSAGLKIEDIYFYHFHATPPMFEREYPHLFREVSLEMEYDPHDWRGYFMASAFVIEAVKSTGG